MDRNLKVHVVYMFNMNKDL